MNGKKYLPGQSDYLNKVNALVILIAAQPYEKYINHANRECM
ncbi:MAG: hypothetical protein ACFWUC_02530 [Oscillospiraceae bacterium]|jgi:hypothetical protein